MNNWIDNTLEFSEKNQIPVLTKKTDKQKWETIEALINEWKLQEEKDLINAKILSDEIKKWDIEKQMIYSDEYLHNLIGILYQWNMINITEEDLRSVFVRSFYYILKSFDIYTDKLKDGNLWIIEDNLRELIWILYKWNKYWIKFNELKLVLDEAMSYLVNMFDEKERLKPIINSNK